MSLDAVLRVPGRAVDLALRVDQGRTLALLGANGAGKSTALAAVAGLLHPDAGEIRLGGRILFSANGSGTWVPPHARGVALLAQEARLFPHLSVTDNVAFGPRSAGMPRRDARARRFRATQGATAASATTAHVTNEPRHPTASARGTATSGGVKVATAIAVL